MNNPTPNTKVRVAYIGTAGVVLAAVFGMFSISIGNSNDRAKPTNFVNTPQNVDLGSGKSDSTESDNELAKTAPVPMPVGDHFITKNIESEVFVEEVTGGTVKIDNSKKDPKGEEERKEIAERLEQVDRKLDNMSDRDVAKMYWAQAKATNDLLRKKLERFNLDMQHDKDGVDAAYELVLAGETTPSGALSKIRDLYVSKPTVAELNSNLGASNIPAVGPTDESKLERQQENLEKVLNTEKPTASTVMVAVNIYKMYLDTMTSAADRALDVLVNDRREIAKDKYLAAGIADELEPDHDSDSEVSKATTSDSSRVP